MKILSSWQIRKIDADTILQEGISSLELMKRAATAFYTWLTERYQNKSASILLFAGVGNNGGDALVVARLLHKAGYNVEVCLVEYGKNYSEDCAHNVRRIRAENISLQIISNEKEIPDMHRYDLLIDGLFGTGLSRNVSGIAAAVIQAINKSGKRVISIDVPSGLFLDRKTELAVQATETVTFQIPKLALYLPDNYTYTGNVTNVPIGLSEKAIAEAETNMFFTRKEEIAKMIKPLSKFAHKGTEGHALIVGGSLGKMGSVCISSRAALKMGCGLVTAYIPKCGGSILQSSFPEAMVIEDPGEEYINSIPVNLPVSAVGIGVGMGQSARTARALLNFLEENSAPLVVDADGLNILAQHQEWLSLLAPKTILTPHPKELSRLTGVWNGDYDKIQKTRLLAREYDLIVVIKGAYSVIVDSNNIFVNSSGTPALATAGSGDALTGMITSLLAQGYPPLEAARVGVYLHGMTADITANSIYPRSFIASDIIDNIGDAYKELKKTADSFGF